MSINMLTSLFPLKEPLLNPFDLPRPLENLGVDCDLTLLGQALMVSRIWRTLLTAVRIVEMKVLLVVDEKIVYLNYLQTALMLVPRLGF